MEDQEDCRLDTEKTQQKKRHPTSHKIFSRRWSAGLFVLVVGLPACRLSYLLQLGCRLRAWSHGFHPCYTHYSAQPEREGEVARYNMIKYSVVWRQPWPPPRYFSLCLALSLSLSHILSLPLALLLSCMGLSLSLFSLCFFLSFFLSVCLSCFLCFTDAYSLPYTFPACLSVSVSLWHTLSLPLPSFFLFLTLSLCLSFYLTFTLCFFFLLPSFFSPCLFHTPSVSSSSHKPSDPHCHETKTTTMRTIKSSTPFPSHRSGS